MLAVVKDQLVDRDRLERLRNQLNALRDQGKINFQAVADHARISRTVVSQFASGKKTINDELAASIEAFIEPHLQSGTESHPAKVPFYVTNDVRRMITLLEDCREEKLYGLIAGPSGVGKTTTIAKYAESHDDVLIYTPGANVTLAEFLRDIAELFGVTLTGRKISEKEKQLLRFLRDNPKFLIIDEFGWIMRNGNMRILETLRSIRDGSGKNLGVVLAGHDEDYAYLMRVGKPQIVSRINYVEELEGMSKEECRQMVQPLWMTEEAKDEMARILYQQSKKGLARSVLEEVYKKCTRIAGEQMITLDMLTEAAQRYIHGLRPKARLDG